MATQRFDVAKYKLKIPDPTYAGDGKPPLVALTSFELRELTGEDELAAIDRARAKMPQGRLPEHTEIQEESISESFVRVNDAEIVPPWAGHKKWPAKVRDFLRVAYRSMNDADPEEIADFAKAVRPRATDAPSTHG